MPAPERVYLDANATAPLDPRVRAAMEPWAACGNASSPHAEGRAARSAIDRAREQVAALVGGAAREILFTSGATEANALALLGTIAAQSPKRVLCTAVEHPSVLRTLEALSTRVPLDLAPVDSSGRIDAETPLADGTGLVSVMLANNESGAIQPVARVAERAKELGATVHCDAVQACGRLRVRVGDLGVDLLTLSAHKMGGPKGAGALWVRRGLRLSPLYHGGEHERGLRAGTENVAAIVGLGAAAELAASEMEPRVAAWRELRALFLARLAADVSGVRVNSTDEGIANTISLTLEDAEGEAVLLGLDLEGIAVATGSACSSGAAEPSHVLRAMGHSREEAERSIRVSMHPSTTASDLLRCVETLARVVKRIRAIHA